jgi:hypothetical protein
LANLQSSGGLGTDWLPARSVCGVGGTEGAGVDLGSADEEIFVDEDEGDEEEDEEEGRQSEEEGGRVDGPSGSGSGSGSGKKR